MDEPALAGRDRFCTFCGEALPRPEGFCPQCGRRAGEPENQTLWRRFRGQSTVVQVLAWLFGWFFMPHLFIWSGTSWPWYAKLPASVLIATVALPFTFA